MATSDQKPKILRRFSKCPYCGSTDFMMAGLGKEMKEEGLLNEELEVGLVEIGGPIADPTRQMLTAVIRMGRYALRDICMGCGRDVTVKIEEKPVRMDMKIPG